MRKLNHFEGAGTCPVSTPYSGCCRNRKQVYSSPTIKEIIQPDEKKVLKEYDTMGRLIKQTDEGGKSKLFSYDNNSNIITELDRKGQTKSYSYSNRNMLLSKSSGGQTISYTYDDAGRRTSMTDMTGKTSYNYKSDTGLLNSVTYPDQKTISYTYDTRGNRDSMTGPFGQTDVYGYDNQNRLQTVGVSPSDPYVTYQYYKNDLLKEASYKNGMKSSYTYEDLKLDVLTNTQNGATVQSYDYDYDNNANIITQKQFKDGTNQTFNYTYDAQNRIRTNSQYNELYAYDKKGNRTQWSSDRLPEINAVDYTYDVWDQMTTANVDGHTVSYKYNGDGLMTERTENGQTVRYYYDGTNIIAEGAVNGTAVTFKSRYIRGNSLVTTQQADNQLYYYMQNGHGDIVELRDATGNTQAKYSYDIWGNEISSSGSINNPFRYSGEYWDSTIKNQYLRARWYDPSMGRFINEDTYEGDITNPLSLNLYTYVHNNPLTNWDPTGHYCVSWDGKNAHSGTCDVSKSTRSIYLGSDESNVGRAYIEDGTYYGSLNADGSYTDEYIVRDTNYWVMMSDGDSSSDAWWHLRNMYYTDSGMGQDQETYMEGMGSSGSGGGRVRNLDPCNCFVAGTKVLTNEGEKNIEDIEVGDKVLSKNEETGEVEYKEITYTFNHDTDEIYNINVGGQTIEATFNHPFYVKDRGWTFVKDLKVGDLLVQSDGNTLKVDSIELEYKHVTVYNMTVDEFHTYFVSDLGIWVHNSECSVTIFKAAARVAKKLSPKQKKVMRPQLRVLKLEI